MMPNPRHRAALTQIIAALQVRFEPRDFTARADRPNRHAEKFAFRVAVLPDRGRVDSQKAQRLAIENVHRHRMIVEQAAKTLVVAAKRSDGAQLLACAAFAGAERED